MTMQSRSLSALAACALASCSAGTERPAPSTDPTGFTFESAAGSFASFGWSGAVHDVVQPAGTTFGVKTTECRDGLCRFEGPTDPGGNVNRRRCLFRMSQTCNTNDDCPLPDGKTPTPCVYIYDTPTTTPLHGADDKLGACAWSYIPIAAAGQPPTISGTLNLDSGVVNLENLTVLLPLNSNVDADGVGIGTFRGACAECVEDVTSNDGVRDGHCELAKTLGPNPAGPDQTPDLHMPCDVNRQGKAAGYVGNFSMDCSPTVVLSKTPPLQFGGSFSSAGTEVQITDKSPDCTTPGEKCFCAMCADGVTACAADRDCPGTQKCGAPAETDCLPFTKGDPSIPALQINQCKKDPTKFAVFGNNCAGACSWDGEHAVGTCTSKLDGSTIGCYPSKLDAVISAPGRMKRDDHLGTVYQVDTANARCIAASSALQAAAINSQLGFPGLLFQKRNFQIYPTYAEDK